MHKVDGVRAKLPFENDYFYQRFMGQVKRSIDALDQLEEITSGRYAYVSLGGPNGADLTGPDVFHSPLGWDRAYTVDLGPPFTAFCAKGTGFARKAQDAYQGEVYRLGEQGVHIPFDINPDSMFIDHIVTGGNNFDDLLHNAEGAYALLWRAYVLGRERGGIIMPLSIIKIKSFPVTRRDSRGDILRDWQGNIFWENMAGWDFFTNPQVFNDKEKLNKISRHVRLRTSSRFLKWICNRYESKIEKGLKVSRLLRWLVGRAFMKMFAPAIYHYLGDSFRIGNAYRQLISNGMSYIEIGMMEQGMISRQKMSALRYQAKQQGVPVLNLVDPRLIKEYMDKVIINIYRPAGFIKIPAQKEIAFDLQTENGRIKYLQEIKRMNPEKSAYIAGKIMEEIAAQLGILHGTGGNAGGFSDMPLGKVSMVLQDRTTGKLLFVRMKLEAGECVTEIFKDENKKEMIEGDVDLGNYKIVSMKAYKYGDYKRVGAPGGGATRSDNLGYGLRDLHSIDIHLSVIKERFARHYPSNLHGLEIGDAINHLHCKIVQEFDLNYLFNENVIDKIDGKERGVPTAVSELNTIFGGGEAGQQMLEGIFWETYHKWYDLSMQKFAEKGYQEVEDNQPIYIIQGSFREEERRRELEKYLTMCSQIKVDYPDLPLEEGLLQDLGQRIKIGVALDLSDSVIAKMTALNGNITKLNDKTQPQA